MTLGNLDGLNVKKKLGEHASGAPSGDFIALKRYQSEMPSSVHHKIFYSNNFIAVIIILFLSKFTKSGSSMYNGAHHCVERPISGLW